jgi:uncharacterized Zn finger protein (UPF0148 family)
MDYTHTGSCPRCGAPVYSWRSGENAPSAHFTCPCHEVLPDMKPLTGEPDETVDEADRKHLAKHRPGERDEPASVERAD